MASYSPQLMNPSLTLGVNLLWVKITKNPKYLHVVVHFGSVQKKQDRKTIHTLMSCLTSLLIPEIAPIPARFLQYICKIPTRYLQIPARYLQIPVSLCKILLIIYRKSLRDPCTSLLIPAD